MKSLLAAIVIVLVAKAPTEPSIKWDNGGFYRACNPLLDKVAITLDCGADFEAASTVLWPRTCTALYVKEPGTAAPPICRLVSWKRLP